MVWMVGFVSTQASITITRAAPLSQESFFFFFSTTSVRDGLPRKPPGFNISGDLALQASPEADGRD